MRFVLIFAAAGAVLAAGCRPAPQPQPNEMDNVVNVTRTDQAYPSQATGNDIIDGSNIVGGPVGSEGGASDQAAAGSNQETTNQSAGQQNSGQ